MIRNAKAVALLVALMVSQAMVSQAGAQVRLEGLNRLYFEHIVGLGDERAASQPSQDVPSLIPAHLAKPEFATRVSQSTERDDQLLVRDFELPIRSSKHRIWIREVSDINHPRISELWWALYDDGRRTDVWYFTANPNKTDRKMLSNYLLNSVSMASNEFVILRVQGEMFRPMGAWWIVGKEFAFKASTQRITLENVRNVFGFFHSYDKDGTGGVLIVKTERELKGRYQVREINPVSDDSAHACRFQDPTLTDRWQFRWSDLEMAAQCLTDMSGAVVKYRDFKSASFIERQQ